jgi:tRNA A-37 threonylcarbamoyl transferase component Bud32
VVGETIASYRIVRKLGEGGMGAVYLGEHQHIARKAAIKVLLPEYSKKQSIVERFFREAMATSRIRHPGIVEIIDCNFLPDKSAYIVMELLEGETLGAHLRRQGRLSVRRALFFARHMADALAAAHDEKIAHRDLKPDNVFVVKPGPSGSPQPIKIVDFGIAKLLDTGSGESDVSTRPGSIIGTPTYMSPEQCRGTGEIDHRTDIYSFGCILFEMLTGRPPFTHAGFGELIQSHLGVAPPSLRSIDPALPASIEAIVSRMLAKAPDDRPQTMRALIGELDGVAVSEPAITVDVPSEAPSSPAAIEIQRVQTTLRSATAEKIDVAGIGTFSRRGLVAGGIALVTIVGLGIWKARAPRESAAPLAAATTEPTPRITMKPVEAVVPPANATGPAMASPQVPALSAPARSAAADKPPSSPKERLAKVRAPARKVNLAIETIPSGADVCLASDMVLLGKTTLNWGVERSSRSFKLLIRKPEYRGQELTVSAEGDMKYQVVLDKLGRDDIDDVVVCKP